ncbi:MAG: helix-turn-helix transcriptional regulator [Candidatus Altiarchaeota archaeon]|nr:helix-turn-helix transcriptional regulator [Candidatus Altiarchaeota archaeon]
MVEDKSPQKPLKRLIKKVTIENLWIYILSLLREKPIYAYEINRMLEERFDFSAGKVTAYVVLYKLENSGYVEPEWRNVGRKRKYYRITETGEKLLEEGIGFLEKQTGKIKATT